MKAKEILPVCMQEEINNFMNNSLYLCVLLTNENMWEWYYEHYVQLFYIANKGGRYDTRKEMWMDFYGGATDPRAFFYCRDYNRKEMQQTDFQKFFKEKIGEGNYIYTFIDESYLGGVDHNAHDFLIYGYDDEEKCFHCICFFERKFQCRKVDYDVFQKSYQEAMDIADQYDRAAGIGYVETLMLRYGPDYKYHFNMKAYKERLKEFIESVNTGKLHFSGERHHYIYQRYDSVYGISIYDAFIKVVKEIRDAEENMDYRPYKTLLEHKKAMKKRWDFFYERGFIQEDVYMELRELIEKQAERAESMRFLAYRHHLRRRKEYLDEILVLLKLIRDDDVRIVGRQLEVL